MGAAGGGLGWRGAWRHLQRTGMGTYVRAYRGADDPFRTSWLAGSLLAPDIPWMVAFLTHPHRPTPLLPAHHPQADVVRALMRQLGSGGDFESTSEYGSGRIAEEVEAGGGGADSDSGGHGATDSGYSKSDPYSGQPADSVEGALSLILNVQPYHVVRSATSEMGALCGVVGAQHGLDSERCSPALGAFDVEPSGGAITGVTVAASLSSVVEGAAVAASGGSAEPRSRWRGKKTPLMLSSNGRPGLPPGPPPAPPQPVVIPPIIIEDVSIGNLGVDGGDEA